MEPNILSRHVTIENLTRLEIKLEVAEFLCNRDEEIRERRRENCLIWMSKGIQYGVASQSTPSVWLTITLFRSNDLQSGARSASTILKMELMKSRPGDLGLLAFNKELVRKRRKKRERVFAKALRREEALAAVPLICSLVALVSFDLRWKFARSSSARINRTRSG